MKLWRYDCDCEDDCTCGGCDDEMDNDDDEYDDDCNC